MSDLRPQLRPLRKTDIPALHGLIATCYAEYGCTLHVESDEPHLIDPGTYFRASGGGIWVVEHDGRVCASVAALLRDEEAELKTLYVHPIVRRSGIGARLTRHVIEYARARGRSRVVLWSDTRFTDAHRLYERLGFTRLAGARDLNDSNHSREYPFALETASGSPPPIG